MGFGLTSTPGTFCRPGNEIFQAYLDDFVIVYIDDLLIYSKTTEEHLEHVRKVLTLLRSHQLYAKPEKCMFAMQEIEFLGFIVDHEGLKLDPSKVRAIRERPNLASKVVEVHQFVGFVQ